MSPVYSVGAAALTTRNFAQAFGATIVGVSGNIVEASFPRPEDAQEFAVAMDGMKNNMMAAAIRRVEAATEYDITIVLNEVI